jgi:hypothetical protein
MNEEYLHWERRQKDMMQNLLAGVKREVGESSKGT